MSALSSGQTTVHAYTLRGVEPIPVEVQVDVGSGLPSFAIVGLADAAVLEARERVRSALRAAGFRMPPGRLTVNLAPAPLRKHGTGFDLPIAVGILVASGQLPDDVSRGRCFVGELALDGTIRPVAGGLAHATAAARDRKPLVGPTELEQAALAASCSWVPVGHLSGLRTSSTRIPESTVDTPRQPLPDFADVSGHASAKRALEIAAVGRHNVLMVGPPGSGKSMLAARLASVLPDLQDDERRVTALVHSVAGLDIASVLAGRRPFRAPHHTVTTAGLCGGGTPPGPGEVSLAHNGILFLDEVTQMGPSTLQALRQPMEDAFVRLVRADGAYTFPAAFTLIAAANPCPCGYHGDARHQCQCTPGQIDRYERRIGGPLLDRMDIRLRVDPESPDLMLAAGGNEPSRPIAERVRQARSFAATIHASLDTLSGNDLLTAIVPEDTGSRAIHEIATRTSLSGRGLTRLMRVSRTIADLELAGAVTAQHVDEAFSLRGTDGAAMPV